ncbi:MAG: hypothetical protein M1813_002026 [Trichoglossum hirsutum]|jgi:hypothetical protein|nr:MAG: hypothetical protein M1813_002026 [Trichoglossum hirsutum]
MSVIADPAPHRLGRPLRGHSPKDELEHPYKYIGYRVFSRWVASDDAFFIVRRFGALNARVMLALQDKIAGLEEELGDMDEVFSGKEASNNINNGTFRNDPFSDRKILIEETLPEMLMRYSEWVPAERGGKLADFLDRFVNEYSKLARRPSVHDDDVNEVRKYLENRKPIDDIEAAYVREKDDLIPIRPKERSWFRQVIEPIILRTPALRKLFDRTPMNHEIIYDGVTTWQNDGRMEGLCTILVAVAGLSLLIGPLWVLATVDGTKRRLGIMTGFITLFFVMVHKATTAKVFEVLAATAAYSAVLMVFLQLTEGRFK